MINIKDLLEKLDLENKITLEDIPEIDLYMDQVIQLFDNKFAKRNSNEKILTKTMINNYAKAKLLFPIKNKKYSKKHIILISLIYHLKGALSINDIKDTLNKLNLKIHDDEDFELDEIYNSFLALNNSTKEEFKKDVRSRVEDVNSQLEQIEHDDLEYLEQLLLISSFVNISNLYKNAAENLVAELIAKG
ncbi:DUF1836 domain-containing protein [Bacillus sp. EAC]|uniref:DUF1836 domain-containing protein n=1 Tax=Bacillus sp. EAC TaxID=1978338 RepID=UPI000B42DC19|nr:DUF1836 domain-containing protein [Bacillus sp. EAC]